MDDLSKQLDNLHLRYREIFLDCANKINSEVLALKPKGLDGEIFDVYDEHSEGKHWQFKVLDILKSKFSVDVESELDVIKKQRNLSSCVGCGVCCKLACSEFSPSELLEKSKNGDIYASQFIKTFVPYESEDEVMNIFPQYLSMLKSRNEQGYYFYHCPKVTLDNRCPDYENRPQICRDFPDNPLAFLPLSCGYMDWKVKVESAALKVDALAQIIYFYMEKLNKVI